MLRGAIRVWDFQNRSILRTVQIPGTMDVKLIPGDRQERAFTAGMFDGLVYLVDTRNGTAKVVFDCELLPERRRLRKDPLRRRPPCSRDQSSEITCSWTGASTWTSRRRSRRDQPVRTGSR